MINLLCRNLLTKPTFFHKPLHFGFSKFFDEKDDKQILEYDKRKTYNKYYRTIIARWKKPLQRKQLRRQRLKLVKINQTRKQSTLPKLVVHNAAVGIQYPPEELFCIIKIDDRQYKISKDCLLILDKKPQYQINKEIIFDQVLLVGTKTYTMIGRPKVQGTFVKGVIQSIEDSSKVIVFKKKRRKQYKKSFGNRAKLASCRITHINHQLSQNILSRAVNLI